MVQSTPLGWGLLRPTHSPARPHLPGSAWPPSFNATVFPSFFMFMDKPKAISQAIKIALTSHACQRSQICFLMPRASILYLVSSPQTLLGMRAWVCDREPPKAHGVERVLWLLDASWRAGSMYWTQRHFCMCINPGLGTSPVTGLQSTRSTVSSVSNARSIPPCLILKHS